MLLRQSRKGGIEFSVSACVKERERLTDRTCRRPELRRSQVSRRKLRIEQDAKRSGTREKKFMQQTEPFRLQGVREDVDTGRVFDGPVQARDQPGLNRISTGKYNRYG